MKALCSWFNAEMEVEVSSPSKTILLTPKQAASLMEIPLSALVHLMLNKSIKAVQPGEAVGRQIRVSAAEIMLVRNAASNLSTRTLAGRKRKHWEALEGAIKTVRTLRNS